MTMRSLWKNWVIGEAVVGKYCGVNFSGKISKDTRPTPDYKNTILHIDLDTPVQVFGRECFHLTIWTNGSDVVYPKRLMEYCNE